MLLIIYQSSNYLVQCLLSVGHTIIREPYFLKFSEDTERQYFTWLKPNKKNVLMLTIMMIIVLFQDRVKTMDTNREIYKFLGDLWFSDVFRG